MKAFFLKNKVFILGLLSAIAVVWLEAGSATVDYKAIALASGLAVLSFIANAWRGAGVTITGIISILAGVFINNYTAGEHINWMQMIGAFIAAILAAVAPPPKPNTYKKDPAIEHAKDKP